MSTTATSDEASTDGPDGASVEAAAVPVEPLQPSEVPIDEVTPDTRSDSGSDASSSAGLIGPMTEYAAPVLFALLALIAAFVGIQRIQTLLGWGEAFPGTGQVTVVGCEAQDQWGADQWHCQSRLTVDDVAQAEVATTLVVGKGAVVPDRPFVGERRRVYFEVPGQGTAAADGKPELVYDQASQLTELTRLYISLLPWTLVLIGSLAWLLGWFVNRQAARHPGQSGWWDRVMFRFGLQRRGWAYLGLGLAAAIVNLLLVQYVVGSVGAA